MAGASRTRDFFENGTSGQFDWVLGLYDQALQLKAESKSSKPENVIKLDKWYQTELPKKIKARGKEAHLVHDELVQTIKWKLARGKFFPQLTNLVRINTPKAVQAETRKAFRKLPNIEQAVAALTNLKGVGTTLASAVLAAGAPHLAPFMADECLLAMPDHDSLDYTMKEYMRFVEYAQNCAERLKKQGGDWSPHKVELAIWTHFVLNEYKAELLLDMPGKNAAASETSAVAIVDKDVPETNGTNKETNGSASTSDEEGRAEDSLMNGEDSVSSPPQALSATLDDCSSSMDDVPRPNNGDHSDDSNLCKNGDDSNHAKDCDYSSNHSTSDAEVKPAENGASKENGTKEIPPIELVSNCTESIPSPPSTSDHGDEISTEDLLMAGGKRASPDLDDSSPPVKKLKPEDSEPATATA